MKMPPVKTPPQFAWALREASGKLAVTAEGVYETFATRREAMDHYESDDILCRVVILHTNAKSPKKRAKTRRARANLRALIARNLAEKDAKIELANRELTDLRRIKDKFDHLRSMGVNVDKYGR